MVTEHETISLAELPIGEIIAELSGMAKAELWAREYRRRHAYWPHRVELMGGAGVSRYTAMRALAVLRIRDGE